MTALMLYTHPHTTGEVPVAPTAPVLSHRQHPAGPRQPAQPCHATRVAVQSLTGQGFGGVRKWREVVGEGVRTKVTGQGHGEHRMGEGQGKTCR